MKCLLHVHPIFEPDDMPLSVGGYKWAAAALSGAICFSLVVGGLIETSFQGKQCVQDDHVKQAVADRGV